MNSSISSRRKSLATSLSSGIRTFRGSGLLVMPLGDGIADREQVLERRLQGDRALRPDHVDAGCEVLANLVAHLGRALGVERRGIVDVADEADASVDLCHR